MSETANKIDSAASSVPAIQAPADRAPAVAAQPAEIHVPDARQALRRAAPQPAVAQPAVQAQPAITHEYDFGAFNIGETDARVYHDFGNAMHAAGIPQEHVAPVLQWHEQHTARQAQADEQITGQTLDALRKEWGSEFEPAVSRVVTYIRGQAPDVQPWLDAMAANSVNGAKLLDNLARQAPFDVTEPRPAVDGELGKLKAMMSDHRSDYWRGPNAERNQARYRELAGNESPRPQQTSGKDGIYVRGDMRKTVPS